MWQGDLFEHARVQQPVSGKPDPDNIRRRLESVLRELGEAESFPWKPQELNSWRHVFHNMSKWLPEGEREQLRKEFCEQLARWGC